MKQLTHARDDVFEGALLRLLYPSTVAAAYGHPLRCSGSRAESGEPVQTSFERDAFAATGARIRIIEFLSHTMVSLCWSDPCSGHMGEQVWHCGVARKRSHCALTGALIKRGDRVYRPRLRGKTVPCNWDRMIHATAIERCKVSA